MSRNKHCCNSCDFDDILLVIVILIILCCCCGGGIGLGSLCSCGLCCC